MMTTSGQEGDMSKATTTKKHKRRPIISGFFWLLLGLFLLGQSYDLIPSLEDSWPILIIILGLAILLGTVVRGKKRGPESSQPAG
jgi:hypothetical protein